MRERNWQIAIFGTFDVENYGDLLFPLIAEAELTERLGAVDLHRFSYHARTPPDWPYAVTSVTELPQIAARLDGALIGGGFIMRFDKEVAPGYGPPTPMIHHPTGYWLTPALIALQHGIPLIWNAAGAFGDAPAAFGRFSNDSPAWADPLMEMAFTLSSYISVRDEPSQAALARLIDKSQIAVVPDTAFGITRLLKGERSSEFKRLCDDSGLAGPYIIIQATHGLDFFLRFIKKHARRLQEFRFLVLPIGPALGNHAAIIDADLPGLVRLPTWPHPLLLAELISQAVAVVGYSYHMAITALASSVSVFTPVESSTKRYSAFQGFETLYYLSKDREPDPDWFLKRLGKTTPSPAAQAAHDKLARHWDRIAAVLSAGPTATQPALNRFWLSLPNLLEAASDHSGMLEAECVAKQRRIDELSKLLALARAEIAARDDRITTLYDSPSMRVTTPLRFLMRNLKHLLGK